MVDVPDLFKTAPREVTRYFANRPAAESFDWRDWAPQEHAYAFTVAKSTGYDILDDVRAAVADAVTNRIPFEEFARNLTPVLQSKGWWGRQLAIDPDTGEERIVQLGSPRRLRTIYWANVRTAHAAGEWERTQRTKAFLPYLVYLRSMAEKKREEHLRYVGLVAPVDDPIWRRIYPPNGWGCQCGVRQVSKSQAEEYGYVEGQETPELIERPWRNRRTGETVMLPEGVDPGWDTNPGAERAANVSRFLMDKIEAMPASRQKVAIDDIVTSPILKAYAEGRLRQGFVPVAQLPQAIVAAYGAETAVVRLSVDGAAQILNDQSAAAATALTSDDFRAAIRVMATPQAAMKTQSDDAVELMGSSSDGQWWKVAIRLAAGGKEWWLQRLGRSTAAEAREAIDQARRAGRAID